MNRPAPAITPRTLGGGLAAVIITLMAAALLFAHEGAANGDTGTPGAPANPLAHLIVPGQARTRAVRISWDAPDGAGVRIYGRERRRPGVPGRRSGNHLLGPRGGAGNGLLPTPSRPGTSRGPAVSSAPASASVPDAPSQPGEFECRSVAPIRRQPTRQPQSRSAGNGAQRVPAAGECETAVPDGRLHRPAPAGRQPGVGNRRPWCKEVSSFTDDTRRLRNNLHLPGDGQKRHRPQPGGRGDDTHPGPAGPAGHRAERIHHRPLRRQRLALVGRSRPWTRTVVGYFVFRYDGTDDPYQGTTLPVTLADENTDNPETTWVDTGVQAGVTYAYLVLTRSEDNASGPSNTAVIEPPAPPSRPDGDPGRRRHRPQLATARSRNCG